ncbi:phage tail protein [Mesorhizobium sp. CA8]|uniref:GTA baseplate fiber-binding domain-containing protein n=1 Tax=Mesorhizobium sp. CA8 TaxID=2876637 RepID=UPI001CCABC25|nr:phage tail protein [Mesorhizobium sp. CA8]MBZ9759502.1 phage tail protein [Mesorhizobium sp. CA8]
MAIIFKRAATDGDFVVDQSIATAGDAIDQNGQAIKAKKYNPEEFIARYGVNYRDPGAIYQTRTQWGEIPSLPLPVAPADQSVNANIPIIIDADTVKTLATQKVNRLALERHEIQMSLRARFADIEPEDILQFTFAGRLITARVTEVTVRPDYLADIICTEFLASVSVSISGSSGRPTEPQPVGTPDSAYYHLDIPLMNDGDDLNGTGFVQYHILASAGQPYWSGATLFRKDNAGLYQPVSGQVTDGLIGIALTALPDCDNPYVTELDRSLTISILSGDTSLLTSATYLEAMNGANMFALGQPGRWEVCHVLTITNNGDGTYTFTGFRRGRKSSEEYTGLHQAGDFMVWLGEENVQNITYSLASLDQEFTYKAVGIGDNINSANAVQRTVTGQAEKIPKPCQLKASIDSPSDIRLRWVRRSRMGSYWADDGDYEAPLGETLEQYVVRIKSGPGGSVLRTIMVDDATFYDYSGGFQIADFGSLRTSGMQLTFDVRQVSGTGVTCPAREATIDL